MRQSIKTSYSFHSGNSKGFRTGKNTNTKFISLYHTEFFLISILPMTSPLHRRFLFLFPILTLFFLFVIHSSLKLSHQLSGLNHQHKLMIPKFPRILLSSKLKYPTALRITPLEHLVSSRDAHLSYPKPNFTFLHKLISMNGTQTTK